MLDQIQKLCVDRKSGSSALLEAFLAELPQISDKEYLSSLELLIRAYPLMAVWRFCSDHLKQKGSSKASREELVEKVQMAQIRTISDAVDQLRKSDSFLTISNSSLVRKVFQELPEPSRCRAVLSPGHPAEEGRNLAEALITSGYEVIMVEDWELMDCVRAVDAVVMGADWIAENGFVNKMGSATLVQEAQLRQRPVYIIAEAFKQVAGVPADDAAYVQDWSQGHNRRMIQVFEWVQLNSVTHLIGV